MQTKRTIFEEVGLADFVVHFRDNYEMTLYYEDFYYIEDMLLYESTANYEMALTTLMKYWSRYDV